MNNKNPHILKKMRDLQQAHWENTFLQKPDMFGEAPSDPAVKAAEIFRKEDITTILELGCGQGRDTLFFARKGFQVHALDYCEAGLRAIGEKAQKSGLSSSVITVEHDVRKPFPFDNDFFDGSFSHMLFCMALTTEELTFIFQELQRVLKPGGIIVYTVRHTGDKHYKSGIHRGEDMYETGGFIVHFFSKDKVKVLAKGFDIIDISDFEEGGLPRKLYKVTLHKPLIP
ncbi:MAG: class I SAM-dependent methyltransferase [Bacillota bacterium]